MNTHIDQLAQWWDEAEEGVIEKGDTVINRSDGETTVYVATVRARRQHPSARILSRAPKPKPAWHDAKAVIAWTDLAERQVWERDGSGTYYGTGGDVADDYEFHDVTPLIEAKVTDEMVERGAQASTPEGVRYLRPYEVRKVLTAALGIETE